jgi:hypothetical protein
MTPGVILVDVMTLYIVVFLAAMCNDDVGRRYGTTLRADS